MSACAFDSMPLLFYRGCALAWIVGSEKQNKEHSNGDVLLGDDVDDLLANDGSERVISGEA